MLNIALAHERHGLSGGDLENIQEQTDNYSCRDLKALLIQALQGQEVQKTLFCSFQGKFRTVVSKGVRNISRAL